jgi:hypothetical protein
MSSGFRFEKRRSFVTGGEMGKKVEIDLQKTLDECRSVCRKCIDSYGKLIDQRNGLNARVQEVEGMLKRLEWSSYVRDHDDNPVPACPICLHSQSIGHEPVTGRDESGAMVVVSNCELDRMIQKIDCPRTP